jgi:hypothetical protein
MYIMYINNYKSLWYIVVNNFLQYTIQLPTVIIEHINVLLWIIPISVSVNYRKVVRYNVK